MSSILHRPPHPGGEITVSPRDAGWSYAGLQIVHLDAGAERAMQTGDAELFVLPLSGGVHASVRDHGEFDLAGRQSVFSAVSDFLYVGRDSACTLRADRACELAIASARCRRALPARYGPAADVPVEVRGAGPSTRQVTNFATPESWPHADRLMCCELITPPGNWSSYPPHKHDASAPCTVENEELYYYRIGGRDQVTPDATGFGLHVTYSGAEHGERPTLDERIVVRDGDVVVIPYGYHGPCVAAPGYPMYYLNVLAGPGDERSMAFCDDPAHAWVRESWTDTPLDPRCPVTDAGGRVAATSADRDH